MLRVGWLVSIILSGAMTVAASWYFGNLVLKELASIHLAVVDSGLSALIKRGAKTGVEVPGEIIAASAPYYFELASDIERRPGYWKTSHKTYHHLARIALYQGRPGDAIVYLVEGLHYNPYYPNAYDMLSKLRKSQGRAAAAEACSVVYRDLMHSQVPAKDMIGVCTGG
jgi:hypothetical protein